MKPIQSTTQNHLDIDDIVQDLVILKDKSACLILEVSAINFGLLSEKEQDATIYAYAQLLNSLNFSIQILIASKHKDISDYLTLVDQQLSQTANPLIQTQLAHYRDFIKTIVRQGNVLDKKFFISLPFNALELGISKANLPQKDILDRASTNLIPKRDHLIRLLGRIGLRAHQLTSQELLQLFFDFYNRGHLGTRVKAL